jgi:hypothetical protein
MRWAVAVGLVVAGVALAQAPKEDSLNRRYGIDANLRHYPQTTPKEALASVLQAIDRNRIDYLVAHLVDPQWVDERVQRPGSSFETVVQETTAKLADNPDAVKELRRFLKEGEWDAGDTTASASLKDVKNRRVYLRKVENRWFLENRQEPKPGKEG